MILFENYVQYFDVKMKFAIIVLPKIYKKYFEVEIISTV